MYVLRSNNPPVYGMRGTAAAVPTGVVAKSTPTATATATIPRTFSIESTTTVTTITPKPTATISDMMKKHTQSPQYPSVLKTPKFLRCLYQILHTEDHRIIGWSSNGSCFQVYNMDALEKQILPKYFKHGKFASFQRQLNNFGFRKWTKTRSSVCTFSHDIFIKCHPEYLIELVKRYMEAEANGTSTSSSSSSQGNKTKPVNNQRQEEEDEDDEADENQQSNNQQPEKRKKRHRVDDKSSMKPLKVFNSSLLYKKTIKLSSNTMTPPPFTSQKQLVNEVMLLFEPSSTELNPWEMDVSELWAFDWSSSEPDSCSSGNETESEEDEAVALVNFIEHDAKQENMAVTCKEEDVHLAVLDDIDAFFLM